LQTKKQVIHKTQILEYYYSSENLSTIGGLEELKKWLNLRKNSFSKKAELYGLSAAKGLLLVGVQGTGKTLTAKAIANEWKMPLLKLDIGKLFGGLVGESEQRIRQMIQIAEAMAPCIIWIDEIDKAFTGIYSNSDSGTTGRVFSTLTTWLSEKQSKVFIIATANNLELLPSELIRKGRFDEIFFLDLPSEEERKSIFKIILKKIRPNTYNKYDINYLSSISKNYSGAEIEQLIMEAMYIAYNNNRVKILL
jgi:SpoVK/Ycf46/Vps4 family AAA+-type ATPase